jgi:hypothetical protein
MDHPPSMLRRFLPACSVRVAGFYILTESRKIVSCAGNGTDESVVAPVFMDEPGLRWSMDLQTHKFWRRTWYTVDA